MAEPGEILSHYRPVEAGLVCTVTHALVDHESDGNVHLSQPLIKFEGVRRWNSRVRAAMLDERWSGRIPYVSHRRSLLVYLRIFPGVVAEVSVTEFMDVCVHMISHPVGYPGSYGSGFESLSVSCTEGRDVPALAPAHYSGAVFVDEPFFLTLSRKMTKE